MTILSYAKNFLFFVYIINAKNVEREAYFISKGFFKYFYKCVKKRKWKW